MDWKLEGADGPRATAGKLSMVEEWAKGCAAGHYSWGTHLRKFLS